MQSLTHLPFDNSYARLPEAFHARVSPTPLPNPYGISFNRAAAELIDLNPAEAERQDWVEFFSGNRPLPGSDPVAMLYAGHQFGQYVPRLGDGRAILLGEVRNQAGARWDLQLKGSGPTPFSRGFDGRSVLRSAIREYLCSEAMHGLGIPTTRALCIVGSALPVQRETVETAATLVRMAPSHVRFGSFEVFFYGQQPEHLRTLADYVIQQHFPEFLGVEDRYARMLGEVATRTARLMAEWQAVGFAHGVMNTDNMSILGITLDFGPFGFLDDYDPGFVPNHTDVAGRYAFDQQPGVGLWNVACLAQALIPLLSLEQAQAALDTYEPAFIEHVTQLLGGKLGLRGAQPGDAQLVGDLFGLLHANHVDYTGFFRALGTFAQDSPDANTALRDLFADWAAWNAWADRYRERLQAEGSLDAERRLRMNRVNPKYILRNYLAQNAITRATEHRDYGEIDRLLALLRTPFDGQPERGDYAAPPPDWGKRLVVSCSS